MLFEINTYYIKYFLKKFELHTYKNLPYHNTSIFIMVTQISRKVAIISGYFQISHKNHFDYIQLSRKFVGHDGILYVIVSNDKQSILKKRDSFIPEKDSLSHIVSLKGVDQAFLSIDTDYTVCKTIEYICQKAEYKPNVFIDYECVLSTNPSPEEGVCRANNIECLYGFGDKIIEKDSVNAVMDKGVSISINRHGNMNHNLYYDAKQRPIKWQYEV